MVFPKPGDLTLLVLTPLLLLKVSEGSTLWSSKSLQALSLQASLPMWPVPALASS